MTMTSAKMARYSRILHKGSHVAASSGQRAQFPGTSAGQHLRKNLRPADQCTQYPALVHGAGGSPHLDAGFAGTTARITVNAAPDSADPLDQPARPSPGHLGES